MAAVTNYRNTYVSTINIIIHSDGTWKYGRNDLFLKIMTNTVTKNHTLHLVMVPVMISKLWQ